MRSIRTVIRSTHTLSRLLRREQVVLLHHVALTMYKLGFNGTRARGLVSAETTAESARFCPRLSRGTIVFTNPGAHDLHGESTEKPPHSFSLGLQCGAAPLDGRFRRSRCACAELADLRAQHIQSFHRKGTEETPAAWSPSSSPPWSPTASPVKAAASCSCWLGSAAPLEIHQDGSPSTVSNRPRG